MDGICTPIVLLFCKTVGSSTGLPTIKNNMICGERSSFGDFFSFTQKCRFECRLNVGLFISNCCMCSREMKVEVMNITMHRNVIKMFRIVIRIIISSGNCIKIDKNERINLMIDCNTYYVVVLLIIIVYLT